MHKKAGADSTEKAPAFLCEVAEAGADLGLGKIPHQVDQSGSEWPKVEKSQARSLHRHFLPSKISSAFSIYSFRL